MEKYRVTIQVKFANVFNDSLGEQWKLVVLYEMMTKWSNISYGNTPLIRKKTGQTCLKHKFLMWIGNLEILPAFEVEI